MAVMYMPAINIISIQKLLRMQSHLLTTLRKYQQTQLYLFSQSKSKRPTLYPSLNRDSSNTPMNSELKLKWYQSSHHFWKNTPSSIEGVMMGRADLNTIDIQASSCFIFKVSAKRIHFNHGTVLDCGAGIGRVSTHLLRHKFESIDMLEKSSEFVDNAMKENALNGYRHFYCSGLQDFNFQHEYDAVWVQWVLTHLHQQQIMLFLERAKRNVKKGGVIFVKENYCQSESEIVDSEDCTIVRSNLQWKSLFYQAKCKIFDVYNQPNWPSDLYPVKMWALI